MTARNWMTLLCGALWLAAACAQQGGEPPNGAHGDGVHSGDEDPSAARAPRQPGVRAGEYEPGSAIDTDMSGESNEEMIEEYREEEMEGTPPKREQVTPPDLVAPPSGP